MSAYRRNRHPAAGALAAATKEADQSFLVRSPGSGVPPFLVPRPGLRSETPSLPGAIRSKPAEPGWSIFQVDENSGVAKPSGLGAGHRSIPPSTPERSTWRPVRRLNPNGVHQQGEVGTRLRCDQIGCLEMPPLRNLGVSKRKRPTRANA